MLKVVRNFGLSAEVRKLLILQEPHLLFITLKVNFRHIFHLFDIVLRLR